MATAFSLERDSESTADGVVVVVVATKLAIIEDVSREPRCAVGGQPQVDHRAVTTNPGAVHREGVVATHKVGINRIRAWTKVVSPGSTQLRHNGQAFTR